MARKKGKFSDALNAFSTAYGLTKGAMDEYNAGEAYDKAAKGTTGMEPGESKPTDGPVIDYRALPEVSDDPTGAAMKAAGLGDTNLGDLGLQFNTGSGLENFGNVAEGAAGAAGDAVGAVAGEAAGAMGDAAGAVGKALAGGAAGYVKGLEGTPQSVVYSPTGHTQTTPDRQWWNIDGKRQYTEPTEDARMRAGLAAQARYYAKSGNPQRAAGLTNQLRQWDSQDKRAEREGVVWAREDENYKAQQAGQDAVKAVGNKYGAAFGAAYGNNFASQSTVDALNGVLPHGSGYRVQLNSKGDGLEIGKLGEDGKLGSVRALTQQGVQSMVLSGFYGEMMRANPAMAMTYAEKMFAHQAAMKKLEMQRQKAGAQKASAGLPRGQRKGEKPPADGEGKPKDAKDANGGKLEQPTATPAATPTATPAVTPAATPAATPSAENAGSNNSPNRFTPAGVRAAAAARAAERAERRERADWEAHDAWLNPRGAARGAAIAQQDWNSQFRRVPSPSERGLGYKHRK
jgi:hypothetical protein